MNANLDICFINTVSSSYSWDNGAPNQSNAIPLSALSAQGTSLDGLEYVCYAPYASLILSSTNTSRPSSERVKRVVDFGDYYNSRDNVISTTVTGNAFFSHVYIMPGLYTITLKEEEYVVAPNPEKYPSASYSQSTPINPKQDTSQLNWHWYNFKNVRETDFPATWQNLKFQKTLTFKNSAQLTWNTTKDCIPSNINQIYWQWNNLSVDTPYSPTRISRVTWNQTASAQDYQKTWNSVIGNCTLDDVILSAAPTNTIVHQAILRVVEIPPVAYLSGNQPSNISLRKFPLQVRLTPRFTQCGSFPIEKIVWDLGDGSPIITRRRWENGYKFPFVYNGALSADYKDPRNFDVIHTYEKNEKGQYTFYPSITAYASSTGTTDIAATVVGPLKSEMFDASAFAVTQNYLGDNGKALLLGEIENTAAVWKVNN